MPRVVVDGVGTHYEVTGDGPAVLLVHGFPDSGRCWRHQVPALVDAGYRVIVPDLRGFGQSDKPTEVDAYSLLTIAGDLLAILDELAVERAHVIGHDFGAALAWLLASFVPDRVDHLAVLSVGHPSTFLRTFEQREKSWYMLLFQFEGIAERWLRDDDWANFRAWARHPDSDAVAAALDADGSLTPGLNYYRANLTPEVWVGPGLETPLVAAPTMGVWSTGDIALTQIQMVDSAAHVSGPWRCEAIVDAGHWMQLEAPDEVNALLVDFLSA